MNISLAVTITAPAAAAEPCLLGPRIVLPLPPPLNSFLVWLSLPLTLEVLLHYYWLKFAMLSDTLADLLAYTIFSPQPV